MATSSQLNLESGLEQSIIHIPKWSGPKHVKLLVTTKIGGHSKPPYNSWNLAEHVNDDLSSVRSNRQLLSQQISKLPFFLNQIHSTEVVSLTQPWKNQEPAPTADGVISVLDSHYLAILTADCLPILLCDDKGEIVAACHAGWRGLANGIIQNTIRAMVEFIKPNSKQHFIEGLHAYIGPAISQKNFEVGREVKECFMQNKLIGVESINDCFTPNDEPDKYFADLFGLATEILNQLGVHQVHTERQCSYNNSEHFYSYRREKTTGRFASCIWLE